MPVSWHPLITRVDPPAAGRVTGVVIAALHDAHEAARVTVRDAVIPDLTGLVAYLAGAESRSGAAQ